MDFILILKKCSMNENNRKRKRIFYVLLLGFNGGIMIYFGHLKYAIDSSRVESSRIKKKIRQLHAYHGRFCVRTVVTVQGDRTCQKHDLQVREQKSQLGKGRGYFTETLIRR